MLQRASAAPPAPPGSSFEGPFGAPQDEGGGLLKQALKLFERIYAPLTAGLLSPVRADGKLQSQSRSQLNRLYQRVVDDLDTHIQFVGLKAA